MLLSELPSRNNPALPLARLQITLVACEDIVDLPPFRGAFWRGVFGRALAALSDESLPLAEVWPESIATVSFGKWRRAELYRMLFAPEDETATLPAHLQVPAPFVIDALPGESHLREGETEMIGLTLIGNAAVHALPAVLAAFERAGRDGLGGASADGHRGRARLVDASLTWREAGSATPVLSHEGTVALVEAAAPPVPPMPEEVTVTLASPLRLLKRGQLIGPDDFRPGDLLEALVRRISTLQRCHGPGPIAADFRALFDRAAQARMADRDLWFAEQHRWSGHQKQEIEMGGLVGTFRLPLGDLGALWPYLWLGQWVHAGKGTVHGMGSVRLGRSA